MSSTRPSKVTAAADFSLIRYAQCWEDADVLLEGLDIQPGDTCVSITSGGDNTLSLLTRHPGHVLAVDVSAAQTACLELRMAAFRRLDHAQLLELMGARPSRRRLALYAELRSVLSPSARAVWDARPDAVAAGIASTGKFERYVSIFRRLVLPTIHPRSRVEDLFQRRDPQARRDFFHRRWNTWRWRVLARLFCSRPVSAHLGRDPAFFRYVEGGASAHLLRSLERVVTDLVPADNPYLHWIAFGRYGESLPHALRLEHFDTIRANLDRLELRTQPLEQCLGGLRDASVDRFNLSDVFEYMSPDDAGAMFADVARVGRSGGRLAYWNTLVFRERPAALADRLRPLVALSERLHARDRVFFYFRFAVEEIAGVPAAPGPDGHTRETAVAV